MAIVLHAQPQPRVQKQALFVPDSYFFNPNRPLTPPHILLVLERKRHSNMKDPHLHRLEEHQPAPDTKQKWYRDPNMGTSKRHVFEEDLRPRTLADIALKPYSLPRDWAAEPTRAVSTPTAISTIVTPDWSPERWAQFHARTEQTINSKTMSPDWSPEQRAQIQERSEQIQAVLATIGGRNPVVAALQMATPNEALKKGEISLSKLQQLNRIFESAQQKELSPSQALHQFDKLIGRNTSEELAGQHAGVDWSKLQNRKQRFQQMEAAQGAVQHTFAQMDERASQAPGTAQRIIKGLTDEQHEFVTSSATKQGLFGGPGGGKSNTLAARVAYLAQQGVPVQQFLYTSPLHSGRRALQSRLEQFAPLLPGANPSEFNSRTPYSFAMSYLHKKSMSDEEGNRWSPWDLLPESQQGYQPMGASKKDEAERLGDLQGKKDTGQEGYIEALRTQYGVKHLSVSDIASYINETKANRSLDDIYKLRNEQGRIDFDKNNQKPSTLDSFLYLYEASRMMLGNFAIPEQTNPQYDLMDTLNLAKRAAILAKKRYGRQAPMLKGIVADEVQDMPAEALAMFASMTTNQSHVAFTGDMSQKNIYNDIHVDKLIERAFTKNQHTPENFQRTTLTGTMRLSPWNAALANAINSDAAMEGRPMSPYMVSARDPLEWGHFPEFHSARNFREADRLGLDKWFGGMGLSMQQLAYNVQSGAENPFEGAKGTAGQHPFIFMMHPRRALFEDHLKEYLGEAMGPQVGGQAFNKIYSNAIPSEEQQNRLYGLMMSQAKGREFDNTTVDMTRMGAPWQYHEYMSQLYTMGTRVREQQRFIGSGQNMRGSTYDQTPKVWDNELLPYGALPLIQRTIDNAIIQQGLPPEAVPEQYQSLIQLPYQEEMIESADENTPAMAQVVDFLKFALQGHFAQLPLGDETGLISSEHLHMGEETDEEGRYRKTAAPEGFGTYRLTPGGISGKTNMGPDQELLRFRQEYFRQIVEGGPEQLHAYQEKLFTPGVQEPTNLQGGEIPTLEELFKRNPDDYRRYGQERDASKNRLTDQDESWFHPASSIINDAGTVSEQLITGFNPLIYGDAGLNSQEEKQYKKTQAEAQKVNIAQSLINTFQQQEQEEHNKNRPDRAAAARFQRLEATRAALESQQAQHTSGKKGEAILAQIEQARQEYRRNPPQPQTVTEQIGDELDKFATMEEGRAFSDPEAHIGAIAMSRLHDDELSPTRDEEIRDHARQMMTHPAFRQHPEGEELLKSQFATSPMIEMIHKSFQQKGKESPFTAIRTQRQQLLDQAQRMRRARKVQEAEGLEARAATINDASFEHIVTQLAHGNDHKLAHRIWGKAATQLSSRRNLNGETMDTINDVAGDIQRNKDVHYRTQTWFRSHNDYLQQNYADPNGKDELVAKPIGMSMDMMERLDRENPRQANHLRIMLSDPITNDRQSVNQSMKRINEDVAHPAIVAQMVKSPAQGVALGISQPESRWAPAVVAVQKFAQQLQNPGGIYGGAGGIVDMHNGRYNARTDTVGTTGNAVTLQGYQRRLLDQIRREKKDPKRLQDLWRQVNTVSKLRRAINDPNRQEDWGHYLNIALQTSMGRSSLTYDEPKGGNAQQTALTQFFGPQKDRFAEGNFTLGGVIEHYEAVQQAMEHMQRTGTIQRGHLDRVLTSMGHTPADSMFEGLRLLERTTQFSQPEHEISLETLAHQLYRSSGKTQDEQFKHVNNALGEFTRYPLRPSEPVVFTGTPRGPLQPKPKKSGLEGTIGTLSAFPQIRMQPALRLVAQAKAGGTLPTEYSAYPPGAMGTPRDKGLLNTMGLIPDSMKKVLSHAYRTSFNDVARDVPAGTPYLFNTQRDGTDGTVEQTQVPVMADQVMPYRHFIQQQNGGGELRLSPPSRAVALPDRQPPPSAPPAPSLPSLESLIPTAKPAKKERTKKPKKQGTDLAALASIPDQPPYVLPTPSQTPALTLDMLRSLQRPLIPQTIREHLTRMGTPPDRGVFVESQKTFPQILPTSQEHEHTRDQISPSTISLASSGAPQRRKRTKKQQGQKMGLSDLVATIIPSQDFPPSPAPIPLPPLPPAFTLDMLRASQQRPFLPQTIRQGLAGLRRDGTPPEPPPTMTDPAGLLAHNAPAVEGSLAPAPSEQIPVAQEEVPAPPPSSDDDSGKQPPPPPVPPVAITPPGEEPEEPQKKKQPARRRPLQPFFQSAAPPRLRREEQQIGQQPPHASVPQLPPSSVVSPELPAIASVAISLPASSLPPGPPDDDLSIEHISEHWTPTQEEYHPSHEEREEAHRLFASSEHTAVHTLSSQQIQSDASLVSQGGGSASTPSPQHEGTPPALPPGALAGFSVIKGKGPRHRVPVASASPSSMPPPLPPQVKANRQKQPSALAGFSVIAQHTGPGGVPQMMHRLPVASASPLIPVPPHTSTTTLPPSTSIPPAPTTSTPVAALPPSTSTPSILLPDDTGGPPQSIHEEPPAEDVLHVLGRWIREGHRDPDPTKNIHTPSDQQLAVITGDEHHKIIRGGPGAGKTGTLVGSAMHRITTGQVLPKDMMSLSAMHSGVDALDKELNRYRDLMPKENKDYQIPAATTFHALATRILTARGDEKERYPVLKRLGISYSGNLISDPSQSELEYMNKDEQKKAKANGRTAFLQKALQQHKFSPGADELDKIGKEISQYKKQRGGPNDNYEKEYALGEQHLGQGKQSYQSALVAYQQAMHHNDGKQDLDYDDVLYHAAQTLDLPDSAKFLPPDLRSIKQINVDEAQDNTPVGMHMLQSYHRVLEQEGNHTSVYVGMDEMQSMMHGMGGIDLNQVMGLHQSWLGIPEPHRLTKNFRSDAKSIALHNSVLNHPHLQGQAKSDPQTPFFRDRGRAPDITLAKSQPTLYRKMFASMLAQTGVSMDDLHDNIQMGNTPFAGVDWSESHRTLPKETPAILSTKKQQDLFQHELQLMFKESGMPDQMAYHAVQQLTRRNIVPESAPEPKRNEAKVQFPVIRTAQARSLQFDEPHVDATVVEGWNRKEDIEAARGYLRNLYIGLSRVARGGTNHIFAADHPFTAQQHKDYRRNPASFQDTYPNRVGPGHSGTVTLNGQQVLPSPLNAFERDQQSRLVPAKFGQMLTDQQQELAQWQRQGIIDAPGVTTPVHPLSLPTVPHDQTMTQHLPVSWPTQTQPPNDLTPMDTTLRQQTPLLPENTLVPRIQQHIPPSSPPLQQQPRPQTQVQQKSDTTILSRRHMRQKKEEKQRNDNNPSDAEEQPPFPLPTGVSSAPSPEFIQSQLASMRDELLWAKELAEDVHSDRQMSGPFSPDHFVQQSGRYHDRYQKDPQNHEVGNEALFYHAVVNHMHTLEKKSPLPLPPILLPLAQAYTAADPAIGKQLGLPAPSASITPVPQEQRLPPPASQFSLPPPPSLPSSHSSPYTLPPHDPSPSAQQQALPAAPLPEYIRSKLPSLQKAIRKAAPYAETLHQNRQPGEQLPPDYVTPGFQQHSAAYQQDPDNYDAGSKALVSHVITNHIRILAQHPPLPLPKNLEPLAAAFVAADPLLGSHFGMGEDATGTPPSSSSASAPSQHSFMKKIGTLPLVAKLFPGLAAPPSTSGTGPQQHVPPTASPPQGPAPNQHSSQHINGASSIHIQTGPGSKVTVNAPGGSTATPPTKGAPPVSVPPVQRTSQPTGNIPIITGPIVESDNPPKKSSEKKEDNKKETPAQRWNNDQSQFGHSMARIGSELQFIGQLFTSITDEAISQGSAYRRATIPMGAAGSNGTTGFFNFTKPGNSIDSYSHQTLPMYSDTQVAQGAQQLTGMTNTAFGQKTMSPLTDTMGLAAITGMDSTQLMQQMTGITGMLGKGSSATLGGVDNLTGMLTNLYGNNLTSSNVGDTLSALQSSAGTLQGLSAGGPSQLSQIMALFKVGSNAGMSSSNMGDISQLLNSMADIGTHPNLQQQYALGQTFGTQNLTANVDLANYNSEQTNRSQQGAELALQQNIGNGLSLPNLQIQISQAQISMDKAQLDLSNVQQQTAVGSYNLQQNVDNQLYGPIGADTSKTAYFNFEKNQAVSASNSLHPETATNTNNTTTNTFGIKNEEFYSNMEHSRTMLTLGRSSLLSDMAFQEQMKNIDKQENFYVQELAIQNEQRQFQKDSQKQVLDAQGAVLDLQNKQFVLDQEKAAYDQKHDQITEQYLAQQAADLAAISKASAQQVQGQGPLNGQQVQPEQIIQALANQHLSDQGLRTTIQGYSLPPAEQQTLFTLVKQLQSQGGDLTTIKKQLDSANGGQLRSDLGNMVKQGAFADQQNTASQANAALKFGGTGQDWNNLVSTMTRLNSSMESLAQWLSPTSSLVLSLGKIANVVGPFFMVIAVVANTLGLLKPLLALLGGGGTTAAATSTVTLANTAVMPAIGTAGATAGAGAGLAAGGVAAAIAAPTILGGIYGWNDFDTKNHAKDSVLSQAGQFAKGLIPGYDIGHQAHQVVTAFQDPKYAKQAYGDQGAGVISWLKNATKSTHDWIFGANKSSQDNAKADRKNNDANATHAKDVHDKNAAAMLKTNTNNSTQFQNINILAWKVFMGGLGQQWNTFWVMASTNFKLYMSGISQQWNTFWTDAGKNWNTMIGGWGQSFNTTIGGIGQSFNTTWAGISTFVQKQWTDFMTFLKGTFDPKTGMLSGLFGALKIGGGATTASGGGSGSIPSPGVLADFGKKMNYGPHQGVDFDVAQGTNLKEFVGGPVTNAGWYPWGGEVDVAVPGGLTERYVHLSQIDVKAGQNLKRGDHIGLTGGGTPQSGLGYWSSGAHSHVQFDRGDTLHGGINPWPIWGALGVSNISQFYGGGGGAGGLSPSEKLHHLAEGGIAMTRMKAEIAENEPEAVIPMSKLSSVLQSTAGGGAGSSVSTPVSSSGATTIAKLAEKLEIHVHTTAQSLDENAQDEIMAQLLDILGNALREHNGKLQ